MVDRFQPIKATGWPWLPARIFARFRNNPKGRLDAGRSSRIWKFAEMVAKARRVFGSKDAAEAWLAATAMGLDGNRPIDLLETQAGIDLVEDFLTRIEVWGVFVTPLPKALGGANRLIGWRIDQAQWKDSWSAGEGAFRSGGRWNSRGVRAVYCALDPSTAFVEVAVHKGFSILDTGPHVLTEIEVLTPEDVRVVTAEELPNSNWLTSGTPSAGQQAFGDKLLHEHRFVVFPSSVSKLSWNLVFISRNAKLCFMLISQKPFALDTRLHPPR